MNYQQVHVQIIGQRPFMHIETYFAWKKLIQLIVDVAGVLENRDDWDTLVYSLHKSPVMQSFFVSLSELPRCDDLRYHDTKLRVVL